MTSQVEYFRNRMNNHDAVIKNLEKRETRMNIIGKKRKYEEAMGYTNDYEVVQEFESYQTNNVKIKGKNWVDAFLENLSNDKK
jgi:hypothetical protein